MIKQSEKDLQKMVCEYLKFQYPNVIFNSDMAGIRLTWGQAKEAKNLRSHNGFPDISIYESKRGYNGLFLELKAEGQKITKKDGSFVSEHIKEQAYILKQLRNRGYVADFCIGFNDARDLIDWYLGK